ncbi:DivIVA domain-containing protein [Actinoplanes subglobosus]|uniref:DivIVA domain-containing protein n=1 Tax=Actinoplanes subglobosus TaxID=1547892 RepID=A0ABV8J107_9ACTN
MTGRAGSYERAGVSSAPAGTGHKAFRLSSVRTRSYDKGEVDAFMAEAFREIDRIEAENHGLRGELRHNRPSKRELAAELERLRRELARAKEHTRNVRAELEHHRTAARSPTERPGDFVVIAQRFADQHIREAERDAQELLSVARTKADKLLGEAELLASTIDSNAQARHTEAVGRIVSDRTAAREDIDRLTTRLIALRDSLRDQMVRDVPELLPPEQI